MDLGRIIIKWTILIIKYVLVNLMLGGIADYFVFVPLESRVLQLLGYEDVAGVRGGAVVPSAGVGEEDGGQAAAGQN